MEMAVSGDPLEEILAPRRAAVERELQRLVAIQPDVPPRLAESMAYSLLGGGKRVRPLLAILACEACGGSLAASLPAACALEMVHTYSLVHDDLPAMDDDDLRRGRPTNHVVYGEAMAILAGDGLLTLAFEVMASEVQPAAVAAACCADLAGAAGWAGMVAGQVVDLEAESGDQCRSLEALEAIHRRKTGRLLAASLTIGGRIAGADAPTLARLRKYGDAVGLAFQITDDILDVSGEAGKVGKNVGKDAAANKLTYPGLLGLQASRERAAQLIEVACQSIEPLGPGGLGLRLLAEFIGARDH